MTVSLDQISCPGVRLTCLDSKVYLKIKLFDCLAISSKLRPKFPLIFFEHFYFDKQFKCRNTSQLFDFLSGQSICIELFNENNLVISRLESNALQFLFPRPQLRPKYSHSCRSLLMDSFVLPIGPKIEFQVNNTILEEECSESPETVSKQIDSNRTESSDGLNNESYIQIGINNESEY